MIISLDLNAIRELLIESIHSSEPAKQFFESRLSDFDMLLKLCVICAPYDSYSNDCRMEAAYFISRYSPEFLSQIIPLLMIIVNVPSENGEDMNGSIAFHLLAAIRKALPAFSGTIYQDLDAIAEKYGCNAG